MRRSVFAKLLLACIVLSSCQMSKNLIYFNDLADEETLQNIPAAAPEYTLKEGDNLYIELQSNSPEVNQYFQVTETAGAGGYTSSQKFQTEAGQYIYGYTIDKNGKITLPILEEVELSGLNLNEARTRLQERADEYIKEATVKVKLLSFRVTVLGEVKRPGVHNNYDSKMTILQAISRAGGISNYAKIKDVTVVRKTENGSESFNLDLTSKDFFASEAYYLRPDDVVYVSPAGSKNVSLNAQTASLFISTVSVLLAVIAAL